MIHRFPPKRASVSPRPFCRCGTCWTGVFAFDPKAVLFAMARLGEEEGRLEIERQALLEWLKGGCPGA